MVRIADVEREAFLEEDDVPVAAQSARQPFFQRIRFQVAISLCFVAFATAGIALGTRADKALLAAVEASAEKFSSAASGKLIGAVWSGDVDMAKEQLQHGADPDTKDGHGGSALWIALSYHHNALAKLLLSHGASVDDPVLLRCAVVQDADLEVTTLLLTKGAKYANVTLREAANRGNVAVAKVALGKGAQVVAADDDGETSLHHAFGYDCFVTCSNGNSKMVKLLLANGAQVDATDHDGQTALHKAAVKFTDYDSDGAMRSVELLLAHGAKIDAKDKDGRTPLHEAVRKQHLRLVKYLLKQGASASASDKEGLTPLHDAAFSFRTWAADDSMEIAKLLVASGAEISAKTEKGTTPLDFAKKADAPKTLVKFLTAKAG